MLNAIDSHNQITFEMFRSERNKNGEFMKENSLLTTE